MDFDVTLEEFEQAWKSERPPDLRTVVQKLNSPSSSISVRPEFVCELVMIDFWHRWRGDANSEHASSAKDSDWPRFPRLDEYAKRYSDLLDWTDPPAELIGEEYRVRRWFGDRPTHEEYLRRFPSQSDQLPVVLARIDAQTSRGLDSTTLPNDPARNVNKAVAAPTAIGKYQILATLDEGGQGRVFRAMHPELRQELAIKLGHPASEQSERERNALVAEARVLAQLNHPNLVRVHDLGFHDGAPYVVLDYVPGRNLRELTRTQRLPTARAAEIVVKIARAVAAAHAHGVMHLDLKPGNILIDQHGEPRLIDFGLARQRSAWNLRDDSKDLVGGTMLYMAPEQARGDSAQIGSRSDVFGLGAVLYDLLVGRPPREGESAADLLNQAEEGLIDAAPLKAADIPPALASVCLKALSANPKDRYDSAESFAADVEAWQKTVAGSSNNRKLAVVAALVVAGLLVLGATLFATGRFSAVPEPPSAEQRAASVVGRAPRHDFPLQFEIVGQRGGDIAKLRDGESVAFRLHSEVECYVGVWHVDNKGTATLLFPNDKEQDHFLAAGQSITIPGRDEYSIEVSQGDGTEYFWAVALTQPWDAEVGQERGPGIVLAPPEELVREGKIRAANVVQRKGPRVSERVIQLDVQPRPAQKSPATR